MIYIHQPVLESGAQIVETQRVAVRHGDDAIVDYVSAAEQSPYFSSNTVIALDISIAETRICQLLAISASLSRCLSRSDCTLIIQRS